jgi:D-amino-acid dehydrogenase
VQALEAQGDRIDAVRVAGTDDAQYGAGTDSRRHDHDASSRHETLNAEGIVVALGSYSPLLLAPIGVPCSVYPAKGYSVTIDVGAHRGAPTVSLTDLAWKIVLTRLGTRLRVAGTAELAGWNTELNTVRCEALRRRTFDLFPDAGDPDSARFWTGLRPATPSNVPLVGRTRYRNLYLDTGHGTLGWTMACGSGRLLADIVAQRTPGVDFQWLGRADTGTPGRGAGVRPQ